MRVTIDTTEAQGFEATEPGPYPMTIVSAEPKTSGNTGTPMLLVGFEFQDPDTAKRCGKVFRNYMLAGKGAGFTRSFWKAVTGEDLPVGSTLDIDTDDILNRDVVVNIKNREYQGQLQNEVDTVVGG